MTWRLWKLELAPVCATGIGVPGWWKEKVVPAREENDRVKMEGGDTADFGVINDCGIFYCIHE